MRNAVHGSSLRRRINVKDNLWEPGKEGTYCSSAAVFSLGGDALLGVQLLPLKGVLQ